MITIQELGFLRESNNIENEWSDRALEDAILAWNYIIQRQTISLTDIFETHKLLMAHRTTLADRWKGKLRNDDVRVGAQVKMSWPLVPSAILMWLERMNTTIKLAKDMAAPDLEQLSKDLHITYETVHPFFDGNGRTGRIFMNWWRIQVGLPILIIYNDEKYDYYEWFTKKS